MQNLSTKMKIAITAIVVIIVLTIGIYFFRQTTDDETVYYESTEQTEEAETNQITVHIAGAVNNPGIVVLEEGSRIVDALEAAGGETEEADLNKLNLAYVLSDGEKLYIPTKNEEDQEYITQGKGQMQEEENTVNINTATVEQLTTLPGIGEATASKIIEYRKENGKFKKVEDLKNVPGIGDSKFQNIKEMLKVK